MSEHPIDLERLLSPISPDEPAGESLRYEGTFDVIREARKSEDPNLPQGVWKTKRKEADWDVVIKTASAAIETRSKDLQLTAWLAEGLAERHGLGGIADGLRAVGQVCEAFWPNLFPEIEEDDDIDGRVTILEWLDKRLAEVVVFTPLTVADTNTGHPFLFADWEGALLRERHGVKGDDEAPTREKILAAMSLTPSGVLVKTRDTLDETVQEIARVRSVLEAAAGENIYSFGHLKENLQKVRNKVNNELKQRGDGLEEANDGPPAMDGDDSSSAADQEWNMDSDQDAEGLEDSPMLSGGRIRDRAHAYRLLSLSAEYLQRVEPHSPTPYLVKRAVSWGSMTLQDLLDELVNDPADLRAIHTLLGLRDPGQ